ncbi:hypothetical protein ACU686_12055 [Yinghuangia aomiensis]
MGAVFGWCVSDAEPTGVRGVAVCQEGEGRADGVHWLAAIAVAKADGACGGLATEVVAVLECEDVVVFLQDHADADAAVASFNTLEVDSGKDRAVGVEDFQAEFGVVAEVVVRSGKGRDGGSFEGAAETSWRVEFAVKRSWWAGERDTEFDEVPKILVKVAVGVDEEVPEAGDWAFLRGCRAPGIASTVVHWPVSRLAVIQVIAEPGRDVRSGRGGPPKRGS